MLQQEFKDWGLSLHRILQYFVTGLMCLCTFFLHEMWNDWKEHLATDKATEIIVVRHESEIKQNAAAINNLTGHVDVLSQQVYKSKYR